MRLKVILVTALLMSIAIAQETLTTKAQPAAQDASAAKSQPTVTSQDAEKTSPAPEPTANTSPQVPAAVFHNAKERLSYALGVDLAAQLRRQKIDVDAELVVKGLQDAFANDETKLLIPLKEVAATVKQFQAQRKRGLEHAIEMLSAKNKKASAEFVAQNAKKQGVVTLPSGLQYKIVKQGDGKKPTLDDSVQCHYRGTLLDGTEFDSSYKRSEPPTFPLKQSIKGWQEALQLMPVGSKWQLFVPPQLGYGERVMGGIGPNATLIFEVELLSIVEKPESVEGIEKKQAVPVKSQGGF